MSSQDAGYGNLSFEAGRVFTPGSPLDERDLFAGRSDQIDRIINAISQRGYHAVLYGDRGVGKTSLSNVLVDFLEDLGLSIIMPRANCDASDDYTSLWTKVLKDVLISQTKQGYGFTAEQIEISKSIVESLPSKITPDDVRRTLDMLTEQNTMVVIFDEFDRLCDQTTKVLIADTIKTLSDYAVDATILLIGVADSVDQLIHEHHSVERALVQVHLPRMSDEEIKEIISKGLLKLTLTISHDALSEMADLSQGLPYVTHLLALHSARSALQYGSLILELEHVNEGVQESLSQWQQSVISTYYAATKSHQPGNIFKAVLAACALARPDELGYFTAAAVRMPLQIITDHNYDIPNFARHLNEFTKPDRGPVLQRTGETRRVRYRFVSPLIRPYVTMRSVADGMLNRDLMNKVANS
jgi:Cdc6-like AAA superfamily ATPase